MLAKAYVEMVAERGKDLDKDPMLSIAQRLADTVNLGTPVVVS